MLVLHHDKGYQVMKLEMLLQNQLILRLHVRWKMRRYDIFVINILTFVHHWVMTFTKVHYANYFCTVSFIGWLLGTLIVIARRWKIGQMTEAEDLALNKDWHFADDLFVQLLLYYIYLVLYWSSLSIIAKISSIWDWQCLINCIVFKNNNNIFRIKS